MFTGIVEAVGEVTAIAESTPDTYRLEIRTPLASELKIGDSLANNGVCLTVISQTALAVGFDLLAETVLRSNLVTAAIPTGRRIQPRIPKTVATAEPPYEECMRRFL